MTSRVKALSAEAQRESRVESPRVHVTPEMADRAGAKVLGQYDESVAKRLQYLWTTSVDNDVAVLLRQGAAAMADSARFPPKAKIEANVPYRMTEAEMRAMIDWYPEMKLRFNVSAVHDHGVGAATRHLDGMLARSEIPPKMRYADFGGNEMSYVEQGDIHAIVVKRQMDAKDPSRDQRSHMKLKMAAKRTAAASIGSKEANVHLIATSLLQREGIYRVEKSLQEFDQEVPVGLMTHVYDVPIADIPIMMERCNMKMMLITVHFSNRFFDTDSGELARLGARYRIDRAADLFEFGFVGSGAKWYSHKWSEFQRYGVDQVLSGVTRRYSYKIVKRRGDTISCRILEVGGHALTNRDQYYRVPDVPCVRVTADLSRRTKDHGMKLDEVFPQDVWNRMVRESALDFMKGVTDYAKAVGNYVQITSGHTYNGHDAVLGTVPVEKVPVLVALAAVSGAASVARMRAGIRYGINLELDQREVDELNVGKLTVQLFAKSLLAAISAPLKPFVWVFETLANEVGNSLLNRLVEVEPVSQIRQVPADVYQEVMFQGARVPREDFPLKPWYLDNFDMQEYLRDEVQRQRGVTDVDLAEHVVDGVSRSVGSTTVVGDDEGRGAKMSGTATKEYPKNPPAWMPFTDDDMDYDYRPEHHTAAERKASLDEEVEIVKQEAYNSEAWMTLRWAEVMASGQPDKIKLLENRDAWKNLDAWMIQEGVVGFSALGKSLASFCHGGVYCPDDMAVVSYDTTTVHSKLRPVEEHTWNGHGGNGQRVHKVIGGPRYTGWVLVNDGTLVYNGPLVINGLMRAKSMPLDFEFGVYMGGPGAGKSYQINKRYAKGNQITSPLVLSVDDARAKLVKDHGMQLTETQRVVRTIDSWLCLAGQGKPIPYSTVVLADEVYNGRAARQYAVWGMMRARTVVGYGDERQIPPVDSSRSVRVYTLMPEHVVNSYKIWRYGPEVLAMIAEHYDYKLRSVRPAGYTEVVWLDNVADYRPMLEDYAILGAYQAHKSTARKLFPDAKARIGTIHESQGKSIDEVFLADLEAKARPAGDTFNLYEDPNYVNVGISRVVRRLVAGNRAKPNLINKWFVRGTDPRRVAACADVATAGQRLEYA